MCLKCKEEVTKLLAQVNLIDNDYEIAFKFFIFVTNINKEVSSVLKSFFILKKRYEEKKSHNMLCLMLDFKFRNLHLIFSFIGYKKRGEYC
jgi:hypothetical protein